jgi:hypothetical protein
VQRRQSCGGSTMPLGRSKAANILQKCLDTLSEINDALVEHFKYLLEKKTWTRYRTLSLSSTSSTTVLIKIHEKSMSN